MRRGARFAVVLSVAVHSSCASSEDEARGLDEFAAPMTASQHEDGLCGRVVAVDGAGRVWAERGCENGAILLRPTGRVATSVERSRIERAFAALPAEPVTCFGPGASETVTLHDRRTGHVRRWSVCATAGILAAPWSEADAAIAAVAPWPLRGN